jgi:hypothetical protein
MPTVAPGSFSPFAKPYDGVFSGVGGAEAGTSITGGIADEMLKTTRLNINNRLAAKNMPYPQAMRDAVKYDGKYACPIWDSQNPGKTLRAWIRAQIFWQIRTPTQPEQWGLSLYEAMPVGTLSRTDPSRNCSRFHTYDHRWLLGSYG